MARHATTFQQLEASSNCGATSSRHMDIWFRCSAKKAQQLAEIFQTTRHFEAFSLWLIFASLPVFCWHSTSHHPLGWGSFHCVPLFCSWTATARQWANASGTEGDDMDESRGSTHPGPSLRHRPWEPPFITLERGGLGKSGSPPQACTSRRYSPRPFHISIDCATP